MTTPIPNIDLGTDPATGLPLRNPNADFNANVQVPQAPVPAPAPTPAPQPAPAPAPVDPNAPPTPATPEPNASAGGLPTPTGSPTPAPALAPAMPQSNNQEYVVKPGDTVNAIAQRLGVLPSSITGYRSGNANKISVGETLHVAKSPATPNTTTPTPLPQNTTAQTGTTTPTTPTGKTPFQNVMDTYTQVYNDLGLGNLKTRYTDALKQVDDIQGELNDKISDVNNNPWLTTASRNDRISALKDKYTPRLDQATNLAKLVDSLISEGNQTAQFLVGHVETDTQNAIETAQKKQDALDKLAQQDIHPDTVNGRAVLVDYKTKKIVADLGPSKAPGDSDSLLSVSDATLLGVPYGTTKTQAQGLKVTPTKPLTAEQATASGYVTRATTSADTISKLQDTVVKFNPLAFATQMKFADSSITNSLASDEIRQLNQAESNFLTAVIRPESGASISPTEFADARKVYFPRPGDDATTLANKAQARADKIASLNTSAGPAGNKAPASSNPSAFYNAKTKTTYVLGADGTYNPQ